VNALGIGKSGGKALMPLGHPWGRCARAVAATRAATTKPVAARIAFLWVRCAGGGNPYKKMKKASHVAS
jgi:hypothetical protein